MEPAAKILVVDDDAKNVRLMEVLLQPRGYAVVTASNGAEALQRVRQELPDLILLDVLMPVVDGFEVCRLLKDQPETRLIPVVMMTALGCVEDRVKGIDAGADDFLTKPVHREELLARIRTALRHKQAVDATLDRLGRELPRRSPVPTDYVFRPEGEYWTLAYQDAVCRLKDAKGLHYLAVLLGRPGRECHAVELASLADRSPVAAHDDTLSADQLAAQGLSLGTLGDAGAALDRPAKAAYKRRLDELRADLVEAHRFNDTARAAHAQAEIDFLVAELAAAVGLGGRDRLAADVAERARSNVTKAIRAALSKICESHPALGHHLATSIRTGVFCAYTPDPTQPISWIL